MALFVDVNGKMTFLVKPLGTLIINRFSVLLVFVLKGADDCTPKHALDDSALYIRRCRAQGLIII